MSEPSCQAFWRPAPVIIGVVLSFAIAFTSAGAESRTFEDSLLDEFGRSATWRHLLYYVRRGNGYQSLVAPSSGFFVDPLGHLDPLKELRATLGLMSQTVAPGPTHPQCRYPARYEVLKNTFDLADPVLCSGIESWLADQEIDRLELVYTSQFLGNPASVFGHTFVLAPSSKQTLGLWMTFNYAAAIPEEANPFAYVVGGLSGWFRGEYSVLPFYQRLFQYGHIENRDLWRYPIRLGKKELELALRHFWELTHGARFDYYFLDENCAGILLRTFAIVFPEFHADFDLPLYIHPMDLIKTLHEAGYLDPPQFIPSQFNVVQGYLERLAVEEREFLYQTLAGNRALPKTASPVFLEAIMEILEYLKLQGNGTLLDEHRSLERSAYVARAELGPASEVMASTPSDAALPHRSHDSYAAEVGSSFVAKDQSVDFGFRLAIHDLLDRSAGYLSHSAIEVFNLKVSTTGQRTWLHKLTLLRLENYQPLHRLDPRSSWRVSLGLKENLLSESPSESMFNMSGGLGASTGNEQALFYIMATSELNLGKTAPRGPFYLGPELGSFLTYRLFRGFLAARVLFDPLSITEEPVSEWKSGLRFALTDNVSLIQQNIWQRQGYGTQPKHRFQLLLRTHF